MKRLIILNGAATHNRGDRAILAATVKMIKEILPEADITIFSYEPERDAAWYGVNALHRGPDALWERIKAVRKADLVLWGGGALLLDTTSKVKIPFWVSMISFIRLLGTPVVGNAQGIGPLNTTMGRILTRFIVNRTELFVVRDEYSRDLLERIGVKGEKVIASVDPAVYLRPASSDRIEEILRQEGINKKDGPLIGIAPRRWFHMSGSLIPHEFAVKYGLRSIPGDKEFDTLKTSLAQISDHLVERLNARILFVPMYPVSHEADDKIGEDIISRMANGNRAMVLKGDYSPDEFMGVIGETDMFLGVRLHSTILATTMNVPSVTFYYAPKGASYFKMIGQERRAIPISSILQQEGLEKVIRIIDETWDSRMEIKKDIKPKVEALREKARANTKLMLSSLCS